MVFMSSFPSVVFIKGIAALRTEFRRIFRILRFPAAFVAAVKQSAGRLGLPALRTELSFIHGAAGTAPAVCLRLRLAALCAEISFIFRTAGTDPSILFRLWSAALRAKLAFVYSAAGTSPILG